jgi:hypothetical protein
LKCDDKDKISVSCLDLTCSITYKTTKVIKDESKDETQLVALNIPREELVDEKEGKELSFTAGLIFKMKHSET